MPDDDAVAVGVNLVHLDARRRAQCFGGSPEQLFHHPFLPRDVLDH
jgi:hypothetical protein